MVLGSAMFLLVGAIYWLDVTVTDGILSAVVLGLLALLACHEYTVMFKNAGFAVSRNLLLVFTVALCTSALWVGSAEAFFPPVIVTLTLLFLLGLRALTPKRATTGLMAMASTVLGFTLVAWPLYLAQVQALCHLPSLLFVVLVCKVGDSGAYFLGRALGRHKLLPHISPGKTVEGAVGSLLVSCVLAVALSEPLLSVDLDVTLTGAVLAGIMLSITAQIGDLVESLLKRRCRVKDSSQLLPAHGGVLDLLDSLLFSFPAFAILASLMS